MDIEFGQKVQQLAQLNKWDQTIRICQAKLSTNPEEEFAIYFLALAYQATGEVSKAKQLLEDNLSKSSFMATDMKGLYADILIHQKEFKKAEKILDALLDKRPENDFNLAKMAKAKLGLLEFKEAIKYASMAIRLNQQNDEAINVLIVVSGLIRKDNPELADQILASNANNGFAIWSKSQQMIKEKKYEEAFDMCMNFLALQPNNELVRGSAETLLGLKHPFFASMDAQLRSMYSPKGILGFIALTVISYGFLRRIEFGANFIGALLFVILLVFPIMPALRKIYVSKHELGNKLLPKFDKALVLLIQLMLIGGIGLLVLSLIQQAHLFIFLGLNCLTATIPMISIMEANGSHRYLLLITFLGFNLAAIHFAMNGSIGWWFFMMMINIAFTAVYALTFLMARYQEKRRAEG